MKTILIAENDNDIREVLTAHFQEVGLKVITTTCGNDAIALLSKGIRPDLIISEYSMPYGTGEDLLNYVVDNGLEVPFILFSNEINPKIFKRHKHFLCIVEKWNYEVLLDLVDHHLCL